MKKDPIESKNSTPLIIQNCNFTGIDWESDALQAVQTTINALQTVANSLCNLTEFFRSQHINIECLLKIDQGSKLPTFSSEPYVSKDEPIKKEEK
jgi:hypothetical protein